MENENNINGEQGTRDGEKLNIVPSAPPFSKLKIVELSACVAAVILGILYLKTELVSLGALLIVYSVFFAAIPMLRLIDAKKSGGGFAAYLTAILWGVLAVFVLTATVAYFVM